MFCHSVSFGWAADGGQEAGAESQKPAENKCNICSQNFPSDSQLQRHLREHEVNDKARDFIIIIITPEIWCERGRIFMHRALAHAAHSCT